MTIEVEKRGLLDKRQFEQLPKTILSLGGSDLGENNTESVFYLLADAQVKVQHATSKRIAKITWKSGGIDGSESREEIELNISSKDFADADRLVRRLLPNAHRFLTTQLRHDFVLHDVHIAIKHSDDWGYHFELEQIVNNKAEVDTALKNINAVADKLNLTLLTVDEEKRFVEKKVAARKKIAD